MHKYIITGKSSSDFAAAMLNKPQDRLKIIQPFLNAFGIKRHEFLFTTGLENDFLGVLSSDSDETIEAMVRIVFASGNFSNISWSRAYESDEYMRVFELGSKKMADYVTSMQVAEID